MDSRERKKAAASSKDHHKSKEIRASTSSTAVVNVESLESQRGFVINVYLEKNSSGLLVNILQVFDKLGLELLHADVSCSHFFQLQAIAQHLQHQNEGTNIINPQVVKKAVKQAIKEWNENNGQA